MSARKILDSQLGELSSKYQAGVSGHKLANDLNCNYNTIYGFFKRHKISIRNSSEAAKKYTFNEHAFDEITPEAAYWLGFIYGDGYVYPKQKRLTIALHEKDAEILEQFKSFLQANHIIYSRPYPGKPHQIKELTVRSAYLLNRLRELGVHQKQSLTLEFPEIPEATYPDFIRGFFDADGSLTMDGRNRKSPQAVFSLTSGSPSFLLKIQNILMDECSLGKTKLYFYKHKNCAGLKYGGNTQVPRIINYLTRNEGYYLDRKIGRVLQSQTSGS